jgi:hypothetical protein
MDSLQIVINTSQHSEATFIYSLILIGINNQDGPATQAALKAFQSDYNIFFEKSIDVDGAIGQQTWGTFFEVIREMIWIEAKKEVGETNPTITYGDGTGIHACGEQFAEDTNTKKGRKSKKDRRVEICFMDPADPIEETPYTGPVIMEPILVKPIEITTCRVVNH